MVSILRFTFFILILSATLFSLLTLPRIGQQLLWEDEAERALLAINTLRYGYPTAWNGRRFITQSGGNEVSKYFPDRYLWANGGWLQYYILAISFAILGVSTFTARLPFWLFGLLSLILMYRFSQFIANEERRLFFVFYSSILLLTNVSFLVYARQAIYYTLAIFLALMSSFVFIKIFFRQKKIALKKAGLVILINHLLLHSNILSFFALVIGQTFWLIVSRRKWRKTVLVPFLFLAANIIPSLPWLLLYSSVRSPSLTGFYRNLVFYISQINFYFLPLILFTIVMLAFFFISAKSKEKNLLVYIIFVSLLQVFLASISTSGYPHFRYISSLLGLWIIFLALILVYLPKRLGYIFLILLVLAHFSNSLAKFSQNFFTAFFYKNQSREDSEYQVLVNRQKSCYFCQYLKELFYDYEGPIDPVINVLIKFNLDGKNIIAGWCNANVVMFYTNSLAIDRVPTWLRSEPFLWKKSIKEAEYLVDMSICSYGYEREYLSRNGFRLVTTVPIASRIHQNREDLVYRSFTSPPKIGIAHIYKRIDFK